MVKALNRFPDNQNRDDNQRNGVDEGRQGGQAQPAERVAGVGRTAGEADRE